MNATAQKPSDLKAIVIPMAITVLLSLILASTAIYIEGEYGITVFVILPLLVGILPSVIRSFYGEVALKESFILGSSSMGLLVLILLAFAFEGLICIIMAAPLFIPITALGCYFGYLIAKKHNDRKLLKLSIILLFAPAFLAFDVQLTQHDYDIKLTPVTSSILINAPIEDVWQQVIAFPDMTPPDELVFKAGISYPVRARIEGEGVGAIRYCEFNTGSFVEPIDVWDPPYALKFHVTEQPIPMQELSPYDIHPPHLDNYFVSKKGQFLLSKTPEGQTLLEGTTWYYVRIRPAVYWNAWSEYLIHTIHGRVLEHIKVSTEEGIL